MSTPPGVLPDHEAALGLPSTPTQAPQSPQVERQSVATQHDEEPYSNWYFSQVNSSSFTSPVCTRSAHRHGLRLTRSAEKLTSSPKENDFAPEISLSSTDEEGEVVLEEGEEGEVDADGEESGVCSVYDEEEEFPEEELMYEEREEGDGEGSSLFEPEEDASPVEDPDDAMQSLEDDTAVEGDEEEEAALFEDGVTTSPTTAEKDAGEGRFEEQEGVPELQLNTDGPLAGTKEREDELIPPLIEPEESSPATAVTAAEKQQVEAVSSETRAETVVPASTGVVGPMPTSHATDAEPQPASTGGRSTQQGNRSHRPSQELHVSPPQQQQQQQQQEPQPAAVPFHPILSHELEQFVNLRLTLNMDDVRVRKRFVYLVQRIAQNVLGKQVTVKLYGSLSTGLALASSDIDVLVANYEPMQPLMAIERLSFALVTLSSYDVPAVDPPVNTEDLVRAAEASGVVYPGFSPMQTPTSTGGDGTHHFQRLMHHAAIQDGPLLTVQTIVATRVPVIKLFEKMTSVKCDVSFGGGEHEQSMQMTNKILNDYPLARKLILLLKYCIKKLQIGESEPGGLTSFPLYLLVAHYFQHGALVVTHAREGPRDYVSPLKAPVAAGEPEAAPSDEVRTLPIPTLPVSVRETIASFLTGGGGGSGGGDQQEKRAPSSEGSVANPAASSSASLSTPPNVPPPSLCQTFFDFCVYYGQLFDYDNCGLKFTLDSQSRVIPKPASCRARGQHLHMVSPFDERYDLTSRMPHTREFQRACFGLASIIVCPDATLFNILQWVSPDTVQHDMAAIYSNVYLPHPHSNHRGSYGGGHHPHHQHHHHQHLGHPQQQQQQQQQVMHHHHHHSHRHHNSVHVRSHHNSNGFVSHHGLHHHHHHHHPTATAVHPSVQVGSVPPPPPQSGAQQNGNSNSNNNNSNSNNNNHAAVAGGYPNPYPRSGTPTTSQAAAGGGVRSQPSPQSSPAYPPSQSPPPPSGLAALDGPSTTNNNSNVTNPNVAAFHSNSNNSSSAANNTASSSTSAAAAAAHHHHHHPHSVTTTGTMTSFPQAPPIVAPAVAIGLGRQPQQPQQAMNPYQPQHPGFRMGGAAPYSHHQHHHHHQDPHFAHHQPFQQQPPYGGGYAVPFPQQQQQQYGAAAVYGNYGPQRRVVHNHSPVGPMATSVAVVQPPQHDPPSAVAEPQASAPTPLSSTVTAAQIVAQPKPSKGNNNNNNGPPSKGSSTAVVSADATAVAQQAQQPTATSKRKQQQEANKQQQQQQQQQASQAEGAPAAKEGAARPAGKKNKQQQQQQQQQQQAPAVTTDGTTAEAPAATAAKTRQRVVVVKATEGKEKAPSKKTAAAQLAAATPNAATGEGSSSSSQTPSAEAPRPSTSAAPSSSSSLMAPPAQSVTLTTTSTAATVMSPAGDVGGSGGGGPSPDAMMSSGLPPAPAAAPKYIPPYRKRLMEESQARQSSQESAQ